MKFGLRGIHAFLNSVGNPERTFPSLHIAGTNGKGSTAAMLAAMLTAAGYRTGLYTSPHVLDFTERIRINGRCISRRDVVRLTRKLKPLVHRNNTTFFETVTAMAFLHFAEKNIDIAVIETGLGGRLDATNVITPLVSVITNIGLEHTEILGNTISKIAVEKAGIIKRNVPCVTTARSSAAFKAIREVARKRCSSLIRVKSTINVKSVSLLGTRLTITVGKKEFRGLKLSLPGAHQFQNLALGLTVVQRLNKAAQFQIPDSAIRKGLARVQQYSGLSARLSVVHQTPLIITDVAHNPDAISALVSALENLRVTGIVLVFGTSKDKNYKTMIRTLKPIVNRAIAVNAKTGRARSAADLHRSFAEIGVPAEAAQSVRAGVRRAQQLVQSQQPILITGSHFVVGEALAYLQRKIYLTINQ
ncbi:MAG TPA: folylpolyglutamate synthase/dihydrofolate synthase family protein [Bacteroidota bacterium]